MRRIVANHALMSALLLATALGARPAFAAGHFTRPGWYIVQYDVTGAELEQGPYPTEDVCKADRTKLWPSDEPPGYKVDCERFASRPDPSAMVQD